MCVGNRRTAVSMSSVKITNITINIINIKDWTLWSVPSPELQFFAPTLLRSSNCSPSLWSVVVWFQRIRFCDILCKCESQFRLYSSILTIMPVICSCLFCGHKGCSLPEVSITSFLPLQFFVFVRLLESNFLTHIKM